MNNQLKSTGIKGRMIRGLKWTAAQSVVVSASHFVNAVLVARLLGIDSFGAFSIIRITGYMLASMAGAGLGITATKYIAEMRNQQNSRLGRIFGLCSVVAGFTSLAFAGIIFSFSSQVAEEFLKAPHIAGQLQIASLYIMFVTLNGFQVGALVGFEAFSIQAKINLIHAIVSLGLTFAMTYFWGLTGASWALGLSAFINWILHRGAIKNEMIRHQIKANYKNLWQEKEILINFTFPAAVSSIIGALTVWSCNAFLTRQSDGLAQMAIFSASNNFRSFILFVPGLVSHVASPILCNLLGENKQSSYNKLFWVNIVASAAASIVVAIGLILIIPYVLILFGKEYSGASPVANVIVLMTVIEVMANAFYRSLLVHGKLWWQFRIMLCWSAALGTIAFLTVQDYGAIGLGYAYLAAHSVSLTFYVIVTYIQQKRAARAMVGEFSEKQFTE